MIHALKPLPPKIAEDDLTAAQKSPAVAECREAWSRAYQAVLNKKKGANEAIGEGDWALRRAMPPLVGYENICNFIACVGYGMLAGRFGEGESTKLLYAAQVALSTIAPQSKTQQRTPSQTAAPPPSPAPFVDNKQPGPIAPLSNSENK